MQTCIVVFSDNNKHMLCNTKLGCVQAQACTVSSASSPSLEGLQGGESRPTSTSVQIPSDGADVWEIDLKLLKFGNKVASGSNGDL